MTEIQLLEKRKELLLAEIAAIDLRAESIKQERNFEETNNRKEPLRMLTIREAATEAGLSSDFVRKLCIQGKITFVKTGVKTLINWNSLEKYLQTGGVVS